MSETKPKQVILTGKSVNHRKTPETFLNEVIALAVQGYVLHPKPTSLRQLPRFMGRPSCTMVTKEYAKEIMEAADKEVVETKPVQEPKVEVTPEPEVQPEVKPEVVQEPKVEVPPEVEDKVETGIETDNEQPSIADEVRGIKSKEDLLAYAKEKGLTVPENKKVPTAIQKWLIQELTK
jgi:hypothetical protein